MSEALNSGEELLSDYWVTPWEKEVYEEIEGRDNGSDYLCTETDALNQRLWNHFQNAAQCVAVIYKGAADNHLLWGQFQMAAGNVTSLYRECIEGIHRVSDLGVKVGRQKCTREILHWVRRKRHFRREELLAFLAGKPPPLRASHIRGSPRTKIALDRMSPCLPTSHTHGQLSPEPDLSTFKEALGISGSNSLCMKQSVGSTSFSSRRRNSNNIPELQAFICEEFTRHKRPAPSSSSPTHDVTMDSPQHKRVRYT